MRIKIKSGKKLHGTSIWSGRLFLRGDELNRMIGRA